MLQAKDIKSVKELQEFFSKPEKVVDYLIDSVKFFEIKSVFKPLNVVKKRGYSLVSVLPVFISLPFLHHASIYALFRSGSKCMAAGGKDVYYRAKNREDIGWRKLLMNVVKRFVKIVAEKGDPTEGKRCLIMDDSLLPKTGRKIEFVGRLWDHVTHRSLLGLRLLLMCYYDGKSTIPVDFSIHRELGKNEQKPYGLSKKHLKQQHRNTRTDGSEGHQRAMEVDQSKIDIGIQMIKRALKSLKVDYVLMDSWFTSERMIECVVGHIKQSVNLIGMMKMGKAKYEYKGKYYDAQDLLRLVKRTIGKKQCRKIKSVYIVVDVMYKDYPVRLYFSRFGHRGKWHLLLSTDRSLSYVKMMELYQIRWTIEVLFKECKGYLNLGSCQSNNFDAQIADTTITMIQYTLLTLKKRFDHYETRGEIFKHTTEQIGERRLHMRLWELLILIMKTVLKALDIVIDDLDIAITKIINQNKMRGVLELLSPEAKLILG